MSGDFSRIFVASVLRDMRTRFGRTYASFVVAIAWPLTHIALICSANYFTNKVAPIGDDPGIFVTTGIIPYIFCLYPARFTAFAVLQNKALLQFSIIKPLHLIAARAFLELLSASIVFAIFASILYALDVAIIPFDIHRAFAVLGATVFLGISMGFVGVTLCAFNPMAGLLTVVFSVLGLYMSSGALFSPTLLSGSARAALYYNPLYHSVGLLRATYFDGYNSDDCDIDYMLLVGLVLFFLGLLGERLLRGRIMN